MNATLLLALLACGAEDADLDGFAASVDCDDTDPRVGPALTFYTDADADGYGDEASPIEDCEAPEGAVDNADDCDDADADVHPAGVEVCDGVDNNCDGDVDGEDAQGAPIWNLDYDGDGYARLDPLTQVQGCDPGEDYVQAGGSNPIDCDDEDAAIRPGAEEYCDEIDNDCDDAVDEGEAADASTWYLDLDEDGYGDETQTSLACEQPDGYVGPDEDGLIEFDCDDGHHFDNPGADEYCDGFDNDCDGDVDEIGALDVRTFYIDADDDGYGDSSKAVESCTLPEGYVPVGGPDELDCDDSEPTTYPGAEEICDDGVDNNCQGTADGCGLLSSGELDELSDAVIFGDDAYQNAAGAMSAGDLDGDGVPDLVLGAAGYGEGGGALVFSGAGVSGELDLSDADATFMGTDSEQVGASLAAAGDVDGDGYADLLMGAPRYDSTLKGAVYVVHGPVSGELDGLASAVIGPRAGTLVGSAVASADIDGDGDDELIVGSPGYASTDEITGAAWVLHGPFDADETLSSSGDNARLLGESTGSLSGSAVAGLGDLDGDGLEDVGVGAPGYSSSTGKAYVVMGASVRGIDLGASDLELSGESTGSLAGWSVAPAGDVDADGYQDMLVGSPAYSSWGGRAYLVLGNSSLSGSRNLSTADAIFVGGTGNEAGASITGADINGDGYSDVMVGAPGQHSTAGGLAVFPGPMSGTLQLSTALGSRKGATAGDAAGYAMITPGDVNSDGYQDVLVGAPYEATGGEDAGAAYLLLGSGL
jgi:hypothetical protein